MVYPAVDCLRGNWPATGRWKNTRTMRKSNLVELKKPQAFTDDPLYKVPRLCTRNSDPGYGMLVVVFEISFLTAKVRRQLN